MKELVKQAAGDLVGSKGAIALTGAGMSTESGLPDIRGPQGIGEEYHRQALKLPYQWFREDPKAWWEEGIRPGSILERLTELKRYWIP